MTVRRNGGGTRYTDTDTEHLGMDLLWIPASPYFTRSTLPLIAARGASSSLLRPPFLANKTHDRVNLGPQAYSLTLST